MVMYQQYFGLSENPFSITPDPRYLFLSQRHREALAHLLYGITESGGFVQLTGEVGTGKTTLTRALLDQLPANVDVALILNPRVTVEEFLASICDELKIPRPRRSLTVKEYVDMLSTYLLHAYSRGRKTVLLIDEAQNLSFDVIEQVRLLTNLETHKDKLLQIILIGQPELQQLLSRNELRQVDQRITARYHLQPLSYTETADYVHHRMAVAGVDRPLFSRGSVLLLKHLSGGIPRLINIICDRALLGAYASGRAQVSEYTVLKAAAEVRGRRWMRKPLWLQITLGVAGAFFIGMLIALLPISRESGMDRQAVARESTQVASLTARPEVQVAPKPNVTPKPVSVPDVVVEEPQSQPLENLDALLLNGEVPTDLTSAFVEIFTLWGESYQRTRGSTGCERASTIGLKCFFQKGNWARLKSLNRPAIVGLVDSSGHRHQALVVGVSGNQVEMAFGVDRRQFSLADFVSAWTGDYIALWRPPEELGTNVFRPGMTGPTVRWLTGLLDKMEGVRTPPALADAYDDRLKQRVADFQRSHFLTVDGLAGEVTIVHLLAAANLAGVPLLERN